MGVPSMWPGLPDTGVMNLSPGKIRGRDGRCPSRHNGDHIRSESSSQPAYNTFNIRRHEDRLSLTLPTAEAGGILVSSTGCLRVHEGLTGSPQAFGLDVSRPTVCSVMFYAADSSWLRILNPSSLRLLAALTSRSWNTPHCGHVHSRTSRFLTSGLRYPQSWQSWLDG